MKQLYLNSNDTEEFHETFEKIYENNHPLSCYMAEKGIVLPILTGYRIGCETNEDIDSGVLNADYSYVDDSGRSIFCIKDYQLPNVIEYMDKEVIYGGILLPHYGHFLLESTVRLYYYLQNNPNNLDIVFSIGENDHNQYYMEFLNVLGIPKEKIILVSKHIQFKNVYVPERSSSIRGLYTKEYMIPFETACNNVIAAKYEKVYFTRRKFNGWGTCFGENVVEKIFKANGFKVIEPEHYSVKEQIAFAKGAKVLAGINGTALHNALFSPKETQVIILNRCEGLPTTQIIVDKAAGHTDFYIDTFLNLLNIDYCFGPFILGMTDEFRAFLKDQKMNDLEMPNLNFKIFDKLEEYIARYVSIYIKLSIDGDKFSGEINSAILLYCLSQYSQIRCKMFRVLRAITFGKIRRIIKKKYLLQQHMKEYLEFIKSNK